MLREDNDVGAVVMAAMKEQGSKDKMTMHYRGLNN